MASEKSRLRAPLQRSARAPRRSVGLLELILELSEVKLGDVHPVLLRRQRSRQLDVALPERDRFLGIDLLVDEGQAIQRPGILRVGLDDLLVLADRLLI